MDDFEVYFSSNILPMLQNLIIALIVLLIGWIIAKMIASGVEKGIKKANLEEKVFSKFRDTGTDSGSKVDTGKIISKVVYYVLLVVVFILFFNILNLDMIANPLAELISTFLAFVPAVLKAAIILVLAFILGIIAQWIVTTGGRKLNLANLFVRLRVADTPEKASEYITATGKIAFYLIILLFVPGILNALDIEGVAEPFSSVLDTVLAFIPRLISAVIIFAIGWFVAKFVKSLIVNLLQAVGSEKVVNRLKLEKVFEGTTLASFVGNVVFALILIQVTISALEKLELTGITDPAISMLHQVWDLIPNIIVAVAIILIAIWAGKFLGELVHNLLTRLGFDKITNNMQLGNKDIDSNTMTPSKIVGYIVQVLIIFFLIVQALTLIKLNFLVEIATVITAYLPNVLAAVLILGVALIVANLVEKVFKDMLNGPAIRIIAGFAKYAILVLAVFMALTQLGIATSIVSSAFILILGGLALAFGLAFGLGGKEFARKNLEKFDQTIEETKMKDHE